MTPTPARTRTTAPPAAAETSDRDREWQATTSEATARIDNALAIISTRLDAIDDSDQRRHAVDQLAAALTALEQLAQRLAEPTASDHEHPF